MSETPDLAAYLPAFDQEQYGWKPPIARNYQADAVDAAVKQKKSQIRLPTGTGKCHRKGQRLLLYDGRLVKVEDLSVGDQLMGPDSRPRTILSLARGHGKMVEVRPYRGAPFVVNEDHMLTLVRTNTSSVLNRKHRYPSYRRGGEIVDVPVVDWMRWPMSRKHSYKLFHVGVDFPGSPSLPVDPYFLGVLLGDGGLTSQMLRVTTMEPEITAEVFAQARAYGLEVHIEEAGKARTYRFSRGPNAPRDGNRGPILHDLGKALRAMGLFPVACEDRFVPPNYLVASSAERREILAGLIDTDGCYDGGYDYVSKSIRLAEGVAFLARSLGLHASLSPCEKRDQNGHVGRYYRVYIGGELTSIPCRVARKKARPRGHDAAKGNASKDALRNGFTITTLPGEEEYYGFTLDGDGRYLLDDFTVTHNTEVAVGFIEKTSVPTAIVVNTIVLLNQWVKRLAKYGMEAGVWFGERKDPGPILVSTYQSLYTNPELLRRYPSIIFDEGDLVSAPEFRALLAECEHHEFVLILTGTKNEDTERRALLDAAAPVAMEKDVQEMQRKGWLVQAQVVAVPVLMDSAESDYHARALRDCEHWNEVLSASYDRVYPELLVRLTRFGRTWEEKSAARELLRAWGRRQDGESIIRAKGEALLRILAKHPFQRILVFTDRLDAFTRPFWLLDQHKVRNRVISGKTPKRERDVILEGWGKDPATDPNGYYVLGAAKVVERGFDVPEVAVEVIMGKVNRTQAKQKVGRVLRTAEGKKGATVYVIYTEGTGEETLPRVVCSALKVHPSAKWTPTSSAPPVAGEPIAQHLLPETPPIPTKPAGSTRSLSFVPAHRL